LPFSQDINRVWSIPQPIPLPPWPISLMMLVGLLLWLLGSALLRRRQPRSRPIIAQEPASRFGYAGLVFFAGIGFLLLLDLSATGHLRNRYLGLNQQGFLWGALLILTLTSLWRQRLASWATRILALAGNLGQRIAGVLPGGNWTGLFLIGLTVIAIFFLFRNHRQFTSELGRLWLIFGAA